MFDKNRSILNIFYKSFGFGPQSTFFMFKDLNVNVHTKIFNLSSLDIVHVAHILKRKFTSHYKNPYKRLYSSL
jgi:hypothetical protein